MATAHHALEEREAAAGEVGVGAAALVTAGATPLEERDRGAPFPAGQRRVFLKSSIPSWPRVPLGGDPDRAIASEENHGEEEPGCAHVP